MISIQRLFALLLLTTWVDCHQAFSPMAKVDTQPQEYHGRLSATAESVPPEAQQPAELVNGKAFRSAIETLKVEMAKEQGIVYEPQDDQPSNVPTLIGRVLVDLPIPPEIELIETPQLVLIHRVSKTVQEEIGVQPLDTITRVSTLDGSYSESVKQMDLESMAAIFTQAITLAQEKGESEVKLELNRLMKGYYTEEPMNAGDESADDSPAKE